MKWAEQPELRHRMSGCVSIIINSIHCLLHHAMGICICGVTKRCKLKQTCRYFGLQWINSSATRCRQPYNATAQLPISCSPPWPCFPWNSLLTFWRACHSTNPKWPAQPHPASPSSPSWLGQGHRLTLCSQGVRCIPGACSMHTRTASNNRHSAVLPEDEKNSTPSAEARSTNHLLHSAAALSSSCHGTR